MYIAMNRFKVKRGQEGVFIDIWRNRDSHLHGVPGFVSFNLLQGPETDTYTLFSSCAKWESKEAFIAWTQSEAFRQSHKRAGQMPDIYADSTQLECFETVL